ncbi:MAG: tyrosine-type recombinase/integrase [Candidatus Micrarchaeota archaeon]|nr:tyrosine-type recombinase/integrase [Candidatus Micrarchaeota archaeon]
MEDEKKRLQRKIDDLLARIKERKMPAANVSAVNNWINFMRAKGSNPNTILKNLYYMSWFLNSLSAKTDITKATRQEIESAMAKIESSDYSGTTKGNIKVIIKAFYKHCLGEDLYYPKQIAWVKSSKSRKKILPEDILSEEEVLKMIEASGNMRDKAIIAVLYDSGIRVGELLSLRIRSVDLSGEPAHIIVDGKTGMRKIPILFSAPYLSNYLELVKGKKHDEFLWTGIGTWTASNKLVDSSAIRKLLRIVAKKAGIHKRMYPHLFRHSRATYYANRLTEQQLKALFGWTGDSTMVSTYVHMSGRDIDDAVMQTYGKIPKEMSAPKLIEKVCPRCRYANGIDFLHCKRCGASLEMGMTMKGEQVNNALRDSLLESAKDPKFLEDLINLLSQKKGGKRNR